MITYSSLYTLIRNEILKTVSFPTGKELGSVALSKTQVTGNVNNAPSKLVVDTSTIIDSVMNLLGHVIPPQIRSGLSVIATDPPTDQIIIEAGEGSVGGQVFSLNLDSTFTIPFDTTTYIWYINIGEVGVNISKTPMSDKLTIAKVIVPKPGQTAYIRDKREIENNSWDAYIVNLHALTLHVDKNGKLEEDSIDILRDSIGDILADNLRGEIKLDEDLTISNTQNTLALNSNSLKIYDDDTNLLSKFNGKGIYFYNTSGIELAKFATDGARIGNMVLDIDSISSADFVTGSTGFKIQDTGEAEFNDVTVRGTIYATVGEIAGWDIQSTYLEKNNAKLSSEGYLQLGSGSNIVRLDSVNSSYRLWVGSTDPDTAPFSVSETGQISMTSGTASGWTLTSSEFYTGSGSEYVSMSSGGVPFWAGSENYSDAPFSVTNAGLVTCSSIQLSGLRDGSSIDGTYFVASSISADKLSVDELSSISASLGTVTAGTVTAATVQTSANPAVSRVRMDGDGLMGYDAALGQTFKIPTDGTAPVFASGQIQNATIIETTIVSNDFKTSSELPYIKLDDSGLSYQETAGGALYGAGAQYGDGTLYGAGVAFYIDNSAKPVLSVEKERTLSDIRYYNRGSGSSGASVIGDTEVVSAALYLCTTAGTPGTFKQLAFDDDIPTDIATRALDNLASTAVNDHIIPDSDNDTDLGSATYHWNDLYIKGNLDNGTNTVTVANVKSAYDHVSANGTSHSYIDQTIVSGATPTFGVTNFTGTLNAFISTPSSAPSSDYEVANKKYVDDNTSLLIQHEYLSTNATTSGTTNIPYNDNIPQKTQGVEFMTLAITPTSATNLLEISVMWYGSITSVGAIIGALFQDDTSNALAAGMITQLQANNIMPLSLKYTMVAGTTSETTFKVRVGGNAGNIRMNGVYAVSRAFGGAMYSSIIIKEIQV